MAVSSPVNMDSAMSSVAPANMELDTNTAKKLEKNFLTCSVCFDVYTKPKCLPCLHTFCSKCLLSYIESRDMYGIRGKMGFPCPMCKQFTSIRNNHKAYNQWLDELPNNFLIQNMIDCLNLDHDVETEVEVDDDAADDDDVEEETAPLRPTAPPGSPPRESPPPIPSRPNSMSGDTQFSFLSRMLSVESAMNQPDVFAQLRNDYDAMRSRLVAAEENFIAPPSAPTIVNVSLSDLVVPNPVITFNRDINMRRTYDMTAKNWADYKPPKISDVVCLPKRNSIIVLDWDNRCVKYVKDFFLNRNVCTAMEVVGRPCSIALLDKEHEDRIVISLLNRDRLYFIRVPDLQLIDVMETTCTYRGITVITPFSFLAASPGKPSSLDLIKIDDRCKKVSCQRISLTAFSPLYMSLISKESFVVSDNQRNTLSFYELKRNRGNEEAVRRFIIGTPERIFRSVGGVCYIDGCVYAVDHDRDEVYRVTLDGGVKCDVILTAREGIHRPASVCVGPRGELVVVNWEGHVSMFKPI